MTPLDPQQSVPNDDVVIRMPGRDDDNLNERVVKDGVEAAETDRREAVAAEEEARAAASPSAEENLDDIDHGAAEDGAGPAELESMRRFEGP